MKKKRRSNLFLKKIVFKIRMAEFPKTIIDSELIEKILNSNTDDEFQRFINELPESMRMSSDFLAKGIKQAQSNFKRKKIKAVRKATKNSDGQHSVRAILTPMGNKR